MTIKEQVKLDFIDLLISEPSDDIVLSTKEIKDYIDRLVNVSDYFMVENIVDITDSELCSFEEALQIAEDYCNNR